MNTAKRIMIMAAGTGGHIFPGLALAKTMQERGWIVTWLGTTKGMEGALVKQQQIAIDLLDFSGMRGKGLRHTVAGGLRLLGSFWRSFAILGQRRPDVVLGMGGYVTVPGGLMARLRGIPLVLINADAALLLSNRILARVAQRVLFGLPADFGAAVGKAEVTGNPVRSAIADLPVPAQRFADRQGVLNILVVGGSLGAKILNESVPAALALIPQHRRPVVTHQSGKQHIAALQAAYDAAGVEAKVVDFIDDMAACYAAADLVICRAGAITISELTAAGVASILVPFVASSTSHQSNNARWMAQQQAALHLPQAELSAAHLAALLSDMQRRQCLALAEAAFSLGQRQASERIADILEQLTKKRS